MAIPKVCGIMSGKLIKQLARSNNMMNKQLLMLTLGVSVALTGCDSLLYSNTIAPMYSVNKSASRMPPAVLNRSTVPAEPMADDSVVVRQAQNNPYANPYGNNPVRPDSVKKVATQREGDIAVARPSNVNDPRIREATEVLAEEDTPNTTVKDIKKEAMRPVEQVKENVTEATKETVDSAKKQVQATKETVRETAKETVDTAKANTAAATETVANATQKAIRPAPTTTKSATRALLQEAKVAVSAGEYDKAVSALERAHRIEPGNAKILYDIAQIRYAQGKYRQASSFASKAATYSNSPALSKKVWSLLSNARKKLGNNTGAAAAAQKAASFQ